MTEPKSLQHRIGVSYYFLTCFICLIFISIFLFTEERIEQTILYDHLSKQINHAIDHHLEWFSEDNSGGEFRFYQDSNSPDFVRNLPIENSVIEVSDGETKFAVLGIERNGVYYTITSNQHKIEDVESEISAFLILASMLGILISFFFAKFITQSTIRPLQELTLSVKLGVLGKSTLVAQKDEIGFLAKVIFDQDEQLKKFLEREKNFTSDASHELRTPLAIILGAAEVLELQLSDNPTAKHHLARIRRTTQDAANLIGVLLLLARSPNSIGASRTNIASLVKDEIEHYRYLLLKKTVDCKHEIQDNTNVFVRSELARVAFGNLIRNAFQYTKYGSVFVFMDSYKMYVENSGESIPLPVQAALFERFNRGDNQSGSGLGLSIVDRICQHTGWQVQYENLPTGGSRFIITFSKMDGS